MLISGENKTNLFLHHNPVNLLSAAGCRQVNSPGFFVSFLHHLLDSTAESVKKVF